MYYWSLFFYLTVFLNCKYYFVGLGNRKQVLRLFNTNDPRQYFAFKTLVYKHTLSYEYLL